MRVSVGKVRVYVVPTQSDEADGTFEWSKTTVVTVEVGAGGKSGLGITFASKASAVFLDDTLRQVVDASDLFELPRTHERMREALRNAGRPGAGALALSAMDIALHDLTGHVLEQPLDKLWGRARPTVPVYGSGGFTTFTPSTLEKELSAWVDAGIGRVKMKIGDAPERALERVTTARDAIGESSALMVDANGALTPNAALALAERMRDLGVVWFEEPTSADRPSQLRWVRERLPPGMELAAGEYVYEPLEAARLLDAQAVDVLQADVSRCGGYTGFFRVAALAHTFAIPLSAHTSPALHRPIGVCAPGVRDIEWFADHVRIERLLFDGAVEPENGSLRPTDAFGHGLRLKEPDARRYRV